MQTFSVRFPEVECFCPLRSRKRLVYGLAILLAWSVTGAAAQEQRAPAAPDRAPDQVRSSYILGPDDQITIKAVAAEEIPAEPIRIDMSGYIRVPMAGRIRAAGLTVEQLETELSSRLKGYIWDPEVTVGITEFRSQPVSVIGAVKNPGIHQLQGYKTLVEVLSLAGGLDATAGPKVKITRRLEWGRIPLKNAVDDPTGQFSVAEVGLKAILEAKNPEENIVMRPNDVVSVPRAEMIYVAGQVLRAGGFTMNERETISVLQALTLAGGLDRAASPQNARILRPTRPGEERAEMAVNVRKIMEGSAKDVPLRPEDILFIPSSAPKKAAIRALEAAIQMGTGVVVWRR